MPSMCSFRICRFSYFYGEIFISNSKKMLRSHTLLYFHVNSDLLKTKMGEGFCGVSTVKKRMCRQYVGIYKMLDIRFLHLIRL